MAIYNNASFAKNYVMDEQLSRCPIFRIILSLFTFMVGFYVIYRISYQFCQLWTQRKRSFILTILVGVFIISIFIHTVHYSDNIVRPVAYFELRVFYRKYLLSTMELKFWANIVLVFSAYKIMTRLVRAMVSGDNHTINTRSLYLLAYIVWSVLSLTAYLVEPMASYGRAANVMIVGEFFAAFGLLLVLCRVYCLNAKDMFGGPEKDLAKLLSYHNQSDEEEVITFTKVTIENHRPQ